MLAEVVIIAEVLIFIGSLLNFSTMRLLSGSDFAGGRKIITLQALIVIALVIFLQVFGTASGEQHDGASKSIAGRLGSAIQTYSSNSGGKVSGFSCSGANYCSGIIDPDTSNQPRPGDDATSSSGVVYSLGKNCQGVSAPTAYAIHYWQQRAGKSQCLDSNSS